MQANPFTKNWLQIFEDYLFVLRSLWLLLLINIVATVAFLFVAQGSDILLLILENTSRFTNLVPIISLLIALFFWCVSAEFCTRILVYMTDNSGHSLSPKRVEVRKKSQSNIARFFLYYPIILVAAGFTKAYFQNQSDLDFGVGILLVLLLLFALEYYILHLLYRHNRKALLGHRFKWMQLSLFEKKWTSKLYGIFNDYRVDLQTNDLLQLSKQDDLPRDTLLPNGRSVPKDFILLQTPPAATLNEPVQVWMYRIPLKLYKNLFTQISVLSFIAIAFILVFSFLPFSLYQTFGATSLICLSFASWQAIYAAFHLLDKAQPIPKYNITYRLLIVVWLCFCSFINNDHPVRFLPNANQTKRIKLSQHFNNWINTLEKDSTQKSNQKIPVFFIAAEGGALRTGAFTAMVLAKLQDSFPDFKNHIYCYSSVSGGTVGVHFFNSLTQINPSEAPFNFNTTTRKFFEEDYLSAVTGKLVFAEILNYFIPFHIAYFDRAIALEKGWELGWKKATHQADTANLFMQSFDKNSSATTPALFINTVEAETGLPSLWSNVVLDSSMPLANKRDLRTIVNLSIPYSAAINLSTRFPLISPAGMFEIAIDKQHNLRRHYVDGGYFENKGQETLLQVLESLQLKNYPQVQPYIIQFNFSETDTANAHGIRFANEVTEVIKGIYDTRNARVSLAQENVKKFLIQHYSINQLINISLDITQKKLPMNWVLSKTAMDRVEKYSNELLHQQKDTVEMKKLFTAFTSIKK